MGKLVKRGPVPSRHFPDILLPTVRAGQAGARGERIGVLKNEAIAGGYVEMYHRFGMDSLKSSLGKLVLLRYPSLGEKTRADYVRTLAGLIEDSINNGFRKEES